MFKLKLKAKAMSLRTLMPPRRRVVLLSRFHRSIPSVPFSRILRISLSHLAPNPAGLSRLFAVFSLLILPLFFLTRAYTPVYAATTDNLNFQARLQTSPGAIAPAAYIENLNFQYSNK